MTYLVEEEVIDVVSEEGSELTLLGLALPHVLLYLINEPGQKNQNKPKLEWLGRGNSITQAMNGG